MLEHYATCLAGRDATRSRATNETIVRALHASGASIFHDSSDERSLSRRSNYAETQKKEIVWTLAGFTRRSGLDARQSLLLNMLDARINLSPLSDLDDFVKFLPRFLDSFKRSSEMMEIALFYRSLMREMNFELEKREINLYIEDDSMFYYIKTIPI